ncbi:MAG: dialkylresorcinol condensing enzyme DarA, partial [Flavobacteriaceae bacterium]|nr:dialkylresorcinol condensing enzyme DarA [Flavobacteriaceae bacterium]
IFGKWANFIDKKSKNNPEKRRRLLNYFSYYLTFAIWAIAPIVFIVYLLTYPFLMGKRRREKKYYSLTQLK